MLRNKKSLSFWFKAANPNSHSWQDVNPLIVIYDNNQRYSGDISPIETCSAVRSMPKRTVGSLLKFRSPAMTFGNGWERI